MHASSFIPTRVDFVDFSDCTVRKANSCLALVSLSLAVVILEHSEARPDFSHGYLQATSDSPKHHLTTLDFFEVRKHFPSVKCLHNSDSAVLRENVVETADHLLD
jgi:hypothetical protein